MTGLIDWLSLKLVHHWGLESHWEDSCAGPLHVLDGPGEGQLGTLVLVHGLSARATHFRLVVREMRKHFSRIVIPDLLGHGLNREQDQELPPDAIFDSLCEVLRRRVPEPALYFGSSLGGLACIRLAGRMPEQVRALVLSSPAGGVLSGEQFQRWAEVFRVDKHSDAVRLVERAMVRQGWVRHVAALGARQQMGRPSVRRLVEAFDPSEQLDPSELEALRMPTLLLWGRQERVMLPEQLAWFQQHLPRHAQVERPEGYGHLPFIETPGLLNQHLLRFAQEQLA